MASELVRTLLTVCATYMLFELTGSVFKHLWHRPLRKHLSPLLLSSVVAVKIFFFAEPLLSRGRCILAFLAVLA
jgi:hypothetical protein